MVRSRAGSGACHEGEPLQPFSNSPRPRALCCGFPDGRLIFGLRFAVKANHIHLIVEADDDHALSRAMARKGGQVP